MTETIRERYEPLETIAHGGQGRVVRARDLLHDRIVALKIRDASSEQERETLLREARVLLALRPHPCLPLLREEFFVGGDYHLVVDWVEGRSLGRILQEEGIPGLDLERVVGWLEPVAAALDHLHDHDPPVVHLDVKPANVIATDAGRVVLVDLGIAHRSGSAVEAGTAGFTAPEVSRGEAATPAADVHGLAATALALLSGAAPTVGMVPELDIEGADGERVREALARGMSLDPDMRPQRASDLIALLRGEESPEIPHNIPPQLTSFVGRSRELAECRRLLRGACMVTLTGPGGIGKTRLAVRVAETLSHAFPGGMWFVSLAGVRDPDLVPGQVASALGRQEAPGTPALDAIAGDLRDALLVLDNCEHVLAGCAAVAERLAGSCPGVRVLATSREPLGVPGEVVWSLPPMQVPRAGAHPSGAEAVRLFVQRATAHDATFQPADPEVLGELCRRLDGIPLAIELAASRARVLSPREMLQRLEDRFALLARRDGGSERHGTLRAAIEWGYDLLTSSEQTALARLSVFVGGFTLEAAEDVCSGEGIASEEMLDLVAALVDRSFVSGSPGVWDTRFGMLDTIREFAVDRLESGGEASAVGDRHLAWFGDLAEHAAGQLAGPDQGEWLDRLEVERDNLRAAIDRAARTDPGAGLGMAVSLYRFWAMRGYITEGRAHLRTLLAASAHPGENATPVRARALAAAGGLAQLQGELRAALEHFEEALGIERSLGEEAGVARALNNLGLVMRELGEHEAARTALEESLVVHRRLGDDRGLGSVLGNLLAVAWGEGDLAAAEALGVEALEIYRRLGDHHGVAQTVHNLGLVAWVRGEHDTATARFVESLEAARGLGDDLGAAESLSMLGNIARDRGDGDGAEALFTESLEIASEVGDRHGIAASEHGLGMVALTRGNLEAAEAHLGRALAHQREVGDPSGSAASLQWLGHVSARRGDPGGARTRYREALTKRVESKDRVGGAEALEGLGALDASTGDARRATVLLSAAAGLRAASGAPVAPADRPALDQAIADVRAILGASLFEELWQAATGLSLQEAVRVADGGYRDPPGRCG